MSGQDDINTTQDTIWSYIGTKYGNEFRPHLYPISTMLSPYPPRPYRCCPIPKLHGVMLMNPLNSSWNNALTIADIPAVIPLQRYCRRCSIITEVVPHTRYRPRGIVPWNSTRPHGNYRGYRGITAFPITMSFCNEYRMCTHNECNRRNTEIEQKDQTKRD